MEHLVRLDGVIDKELDTDDLVEETIQKLNWYRVWGWTISF